MNEKFILTIINKFCNSPIAELDLNDETTRLVLKKAAGGENREQTREEISGENQSEKSVRLGISANAAENQNGDGEKITSPIVATFYSSPCPDAPPYVMPGSKVKTGQTLCILEAMKMMNHLEAEFDCEIVEVHAANGDMVEFGQTIFTVKRL